MQGDTGENTDKYIRIDTPSTDSKELRAPNKLNQYVKLSNVCARRTNFFIVPHKRKRVDQLAARILTVLTTN